MQFTAMTVPFRELSLWGSGMWETLIVPGWEDGT